MRGTGTTDMYPVTKPAPDMQMYLLLGTDVRVSVKTDGSMLMKVSTVLSTMTKPEVDRLLTLAAFTVSRFASTAEAATKTELYKLVREAERSPPKPAFKIWGDIRVMLQKPQPDAIVATIGRFTCH